MPSYGEACSTGNAIVSSASLALPRRTASQPQIRSQAHSPSHSEGGTADVTRKPSVAISARYPRVAVVLGVQPRWHIPLLLCRALSTISAAWWACQACFSIYQIVHQTETSVAQYASSNGVHDLLENQTFRRIAIAQVCLSFLWVRTTVLTYRSA